MQNPTFPHDLPPAAAVPVSSVFDLIKSSIVAGRRFTGGSPAPAPSPSFPAPQSPTSPIIKAPPSTPRPPLRAPSRNFPSSRPRSSSSPQFTFKEFPGAAPARVQGAGEKIRLQKDAKEEEDTDEVKGEILTNKIDNIIDLMKGNVEKKRKLPEKKGSNVAEHDDEINKTDKLILNNKEKATEKNEKVEDFGFDNNIENLVRKIVIETLNQSKNIPEIMVEEEKKKNLNALDAILENLFIDEYTGSANLNLKELNEDQSIYFRETEEKMTTSESAVDERTVVITEELLDEIVESMFPFPALETEDIKKKEKAMETETDSSIDEDFGAVEKALAALLGDKLSDEDRLTTEVTNMILSELLPPRSLVPF